MKKNQSSKVSYLIKPPKFCSFVTGSSGPFFTQVHRLIYFIQWNDPSFCIAIKHQVITDFTTIYYMAQWLRRWIPSPRVPCSTSLSGLKVHSAFHPSEVGKMSTRNQALTNRVRAYVMYSKSKILYITVVDYFLANKSRNTFSVFWVREANFINQAYMYFKTICASNS